MIREDSVWESRRARTRYLGPASGAMFAVGLNSAPSGTNDELGKELTLSLHATLQRAGFI